MSLFASTGVGCCVCGATHLADAPNVHLARQLGHPDPAPEEVTWRCEACERLVCRHCVVTISTGMAAPFDREIPFETLCTDPKCVADRTEREAADDAAWRVR